MNSQGYQQVQKQTQSLVLAPQLRNSLKILQAPAVELRTSILGELQANPLLEELAIESISVEQQNEEPSSNELEQDEETEFNPEDFSALERISEDMREYYAQENTGQSYTSEDLERREHFMNSLTTSVSLQQHLIEQAELADCSNQEREALLYLIGSIDDNGFLTETVSNIALNSGIPYSSVNKASQTLKTFDPTGIGTQDIQDCLATQLELRGRGTSIAARILRDHFKLLLRRRIPELSRKLGSSSEEIQDAIEEIATLDHAPAKRFSPDSNAVVEPDVTVCKDEYGEWKITLNNDYIPRLRISSTYKDMLAKGNLNKKEKEFMLEHMRSGKFLINSIEHRQQTIERITQQILEFQSDFLNAGVAKLRPLTMNAIAQTVGVHETTISRAIANKFIRTPHGVFAFKYFFTPGYTSSSGESVSNKVIKDMISHIIGEENPAKPYSDQAIVKLLTEKEIKIARRTVAKYREELDILPTNLRRRYQ
ncbi:MAG TPA: RNA polymerase sigma-54 factor [Opitutae bacterium]|nr:RNA polymerase sigma-54 factor [Opitutae bacterium]